MGSRALLSAAISALLLSAATLCSCQAGNTPTEDGNQLPPSGAAPENPPRQLQAQLYPVKMSPQLPVDLPAELVQSLPEIPAIPAAGGRTPSFLEEDLIRDAGEFNATFPYANVAAQDDWASFSPDWNTGLDPPHTDFAYCIYRFELSGFDRSPTAMFLWHTPPADFADFWIGLGRISTRSWDWYEGPADNVLTVDSFVPYISPGGYFYLAVVLLGQDQALLEQIIIDQPELRGTGELELVMEPCPPPLDPGGPLPAMVNLTPGCPEVHDQGWWASCTAFAVGDCALNYDLQAIYGSLGWDNADPFNLVSPKYMYIESGKDLGQTSPDEGRYTGSVVAWAEANGVPTELNAPYDFTTRDDWSPDALADVPLLTAEDWFCLAATGSEGLINIKALLANHRRPVIFRVNIDQGFLDYESGDVWHYSGPALGSHAMCFIGYDDAAEGGGAFLARNSWGPDWGDSGNIWISYDLMSADDAEPWIWKLEDEYNALTAQRFCGQQAAVEPPTRLQASEGDFLHWVRLSWQKSPGAIGYNIYRDVRTNLVASLGDVETWDDTGITNQLSHTYWVTALVGPAESDLSAPDLGWLPYSPTVFKHSWGGADAEDGRDMAVDGSGNVYLAGSTSSYGAGNGDILLCKYNSFGFFQWARTWGGGASDYGTALALDANSNIVVAGNTLSFGNGSEFALLRFSPDGTIQLQRTWGGSADDRAFGIGIDGNGDIYLAGNTDSFAPGNQAVALVKFDASGNLLGQATWGKTDTNSAGDLVVSGDDLFVAGYSTDFGAGNRDVLLLKYDAALNLDWARVWGGAENDQAQAMALSGSSILLAGFTSGFGEGLSDALLVQYGADGDFHSALTWGGSDFDGAYGVAADSLGDVYLSGQTWSLGAGGIDVFLLRLNGGTTPAYQRTWGTGDDDWANRIVADEFDRLYIAAQSKDSTADWRDVVGQFATPAGTADVATGSAGTPTGVANPVSGTVTSPSGTEDSGGGGQDALVLKVFP